MKKLKSCGDRLVLLIVKLGEKATVRNIARSHLTGADFEQAKQDAAGFVAFEWVYQLTRISRYGSPQRSRKASWTARLTKQGIWRAAQLGVPYNSGLVANLLAEKDAPAPHSKAERTLVAEQAEYKRDALEFRRQIAARKTAKDAAEKAALVAPRRKRTARHYEELNRFLESRGKPPAKVVPAFAQPARMIQSPAKQYAAQSGQIPGRYGRDEQRPSAPISTPAPSSDTDFYRQYIANTFGHHGPRPTVRTPDIPSSENERIKERIRKQGYGAAIEGEQVRFANVLISFQAWEVENPE